MRYFLFILAVFVFQLSPNEVRSQEATLEVKPLVVPKDASGDVVPLEADSLEKTDFVEEGDSAIKSVHPNDMSSLLFTYWERTAIQDARRSIGMVRAPTASELRRGLQQGFEEEEKIKPPPEERDITLSGIVYRSRDDWVIWLNGKRISPNAIPKEIIDINVYDEYIEIKWFDEWSNQVFPIRLKPHQRFNIDTRIFLPG